MADEELFPLVDPEGNVIGSATRRECHSGSMLLHPVVHLHVFSPYCFKNALKTKTYSRADGTHQSAVM